jgi:hypothetical protein
MKRLCHLRAMEWGILAEKLPLWEFLINNSPKKQVLAVLPSRQISFRGVASTELRMTLYRFSHSEVIRLNV